MPKGVFNIVNGGFDTVKQICEHKDIKAISFVGGNSAGEYIHTEGSKVQFLFINYMEFNL